MKVCAIGAIGRSPTTQLCSLQARCSYSCSIVMEGEEGERMWQPEVVVFTCYFIHVLSRDIHCSRAVP